MTEFEDDDKMMIGISEANKDYLYGDIIISMIYVPVYFFKKSGFGIKDFKLLTKIQRNNIYKNLSSKVRWQLRRIKPYEMENKNLEDIEMKCVIDMLNTVPIFWEKEVYINNLDKESFSERFNKFTTENLRKLNIDFNKENWHIFNGNCKNKASQLAGIFAKSYCDNDSKILYEIYGDIIGSGLPTDKKTIKFIKNHADDYPSFVRKEILK